MMMMPSRISRWRGDGGERETLTSDANLPRNGRKIVCDDGLSPKRAHGWGQLIRVLFKTIIISTYDRSCIRG